MYPFVRHSAKMSRFATGRIRCGGLASFRNRIFFENFAPPFPEKDVRNGPQSKETFSLAKQKQ